MKSESKILWLRSNNLSFYRYILFFPTRQKEQNWNSDVHR